MREFVGTYTYTSQADIPDPKDENYGKDFYDRTERKVWATANSAKAVEDHYDKSGKRLQRHVYCYNPDYAFHVRQQVEGGPYVLMKYGGDPVTVDRIKRDVDMMLRFVRMPYLGWGHPHSIADTLKDPMCRIDSLRTIAEGGRTLLQLKSDLTFHEKSNPRIPLVNHSTITFDPAAGWRIVVDDSNGPYVRWVTSIHYRQTGPDGPCYVSEAVVKASSPTDPSTNTERYNIHSLAFTNTPASEFRLGSVGMAEMPVEKPRSPWRIFIIGASLLVLSLLFYLAYRRGKRRPPAQLH